MAQPDKPVFVPAFPPNAGWRDDDPECRGMSLRDYFAAQAMQGLLSEGRWVSNVSVAIQKKHGESAADILHDTIATKAYLIADAMIAVREAADG